MPLIIVLHLSYLGTGLATIRILFRSREYPWLLRLILAYYVGIFIHIVISHLAIVFTITSPIVTWVLLCIGLLGLLFEVANGLTTSVFSFGGFPADYKHKCLNVFLAIG